MSNRSQSQVTPADPYQDQVIKSRSLGVRVVAPAGSGKTEALVRRAVSRIESGEVASRRMLVLSFDHSAKKSFEQKYHRFAPRLSTPNVITINKYGQDFLKRTFPGEVGTLRQDAGLRKAFDQRYAHLDVPHWDGRHRKITDAFNAFKDQGYSVHDSRQGRAPEWLRRHFLQLPDDSENISASDLWDLEESPTSGEQYATDLDTILDAYRLFDLEMREHGWMDFSDQKLRALMCLRRDAGACRDEQSRYDEIVVDECQDINRLDALLIRYITGPATTLVVAGDDDQSLYEFREANSLYLREPSRHFNRDFETCHLNINYRTPQELLEPALRLIDHNTERIPKSPHSGVARPGKWETIRASSETDLTRMIVTRIEALMSGQTVTDEPVRLEEIGVLCAKPANVSRFRTALTRAKIPWVEVPGTENYQASASGVTVDTMLKAKGRQWRVVILPDASDAQVPGANAMRLGDIESERRKFYVAMTRPSEHLIVGYVSNNSFDVAMRTSEGEIVATNGASRFLFEAGLVNDPVVSAVPEETAAMPQPANGQVTAAHSEGPAISQVTSRSETSGATPIIDQKHALVAASVDQPPLTSSKTRTTSKVKIKPILKYWDVRDAERQAIEKARTQLDARDYTYAAVEAFDHAVIPFLTRNIKTGTERSRKAKDAVEVIDQVHEMFKADIRWIDRLHTWRKARNRAVHDPPPLSLHQELALQDMVSEAPTLYAFVKSQREAGQPKPAVEFQQPPPIIGNVRAPFTDSDRLERIRTLAEIIQSGQPHPKTGKRIRALRFDPDTFREEMLILQLHFLLRDVRFHIAESYRWSQSPVFAQLSLRELQFCHVAIRGNGRHGLQPPTPRYANALVDVLAGIVEEHFPVDRAGALLTMWNDAQSIQNGNYPAGFKIRAYRT